MLFQRSAARFAALLLLAGALVAPPATLRAQDSGAAEGEAKPSSLLDRLKLAKEEAGEEAEAKKAETATCALLDIDGLVDEKGASGGFASPAGMSLRKVLFALRDIAENDDIDALVIRMNDFQGGLAQAQELHSMLLEVRASKPVHVFLTGSGVAEIYLASAGTSVTVPPAYSAILNGVGADMMFFKRLMGKVGVEMEVLQMGKYKSAVEQYSREGMSDPSRESYKALLETVFDELADGIAEGRGMSAKSAKSLLSLGFVDGEQLQGLNLIDHVGGELAFNDRLADELGKEVEFEDAIKKEENPFESDSPFALFSALMGKPEKKSVKPNSIAVLYMTGNIVDGPIEEAAYEDGYISAYPLVNLIEEIREEENIVAVVLRVDSGGGSAYASDQLWEAIERLKADKPVVASMAGVAASGGYYVSMGCDYIFADPMTITGSIGVIGAKPYAGDLVKSVGIDIDSVSVGRRINPFSLYHKWTPEEYASLIDNMEETYQDFIGKAAAGRGREVAYIHEHAQGRVWSGRDAIKLGLVDQAGGLLAALDKAEELAGLVVEEDHPLQVYPGKLSFSQILERAFGGLQVAAGVAPVRGDAAWRLPFSRLVEASFGPLALELIPAQVLDQMGVLYHVFKSEGVALAQPAIVVFN